MTRSGREHLVERFLDCEMNLDEEREFVLQVAVDPELFNLLRAYRLMERALHRGSARFLAAMPAVDASTRLVETAGTASVAPAAAGAFGLSSWVVSVVVGLLAASAGFLVRPIIAPTEQVVMSRNTPAVMKPVPNRPVPIVEADSVVVSSPETAPAVTGTSPRPRSSDHRPLQRTRSVSLQSRVSSADQGEGEIQTNIGRVPADTIRRNINADTSRVGKIKVTLPESDSDSP